ncbi:MAG TPA: hypothetical protein VFA23_03005 [Dongiaceae bacterium]|nr:hypothetical protein [Dongiaceae bacterium]
MDKAWTYFLRGWTFYLYSKKDANAEARRLYRQAIRLKPDFARAHADLAYSLLHAWIYKWDPAVTLDEVQKHIRRALKIDENYYYNHWILAAYHLYCRNHDLAAATYDKALALARRQAIPEEMGALRVDRAEMLMFSGDAAAAVKEARAVIDGMGHAPERWYYWVLGWALYENGRYRESLKVLANIANPRNNIRKSVIASHVALRQMDEARRHAALFLKEEKMHGVTYRPKERSVVPALHSVEDRLPYKNPDRHARWKAHLAEAFEGLRQS